MSGSAQPGTGIQAGQQLKNRLIPGLEQEPVNPFNPFLWIKNKNNVEPAAANVFFPQINTQLPQGMPNYQQLMQQNMLQGQQRIQNVPNVRGFFGGQE